MSERLQHAEGAPQHQAEIERAAAERLKNLERSGELPEHKQANVESARERLRQAEQVRPAAEAASTAEPATAAPKVLTKTANYRHTMISLRHRMKPAARSFSKLIHAPIVESVSEVAGKTVLRPSVTLGATTTAVFLAGFLYLFDRHYGFVLRGSEIWLTLLLGAIVGLVIEGIQRGLRRARHR